MTTSNFQWLSWSRLLTFVFTYLMKGVVGCGEGVVYLTSYFK